MRRSAYSERYSAVVRRSAKVRPDGESAEVKVDARSERWREHRKKVRAEIVDAAFRAIDRLGPAVSLREIAEEAGTAKPKIYRHFADKSDLFQAIGERMRDMLWSAIIPSVPAGSKQRTGDSSTVSRSATPGRRPSRPATACTAG